MFFDSGWDSIFCQKTKFSGKCSWFIHAQVKNSGNENEFQCFSWVPFFNSKSDKRSQVSICFLFFQEPKTQKKIPGKSLKITWTLTNSIWERSCYIKISSHRHVKEKARRFVKIKRETKKNEHFHESMTSKLSKKPNNLWKNLTKPKKFWY